MNASEDVADKKARILNGIIALITRTIRASTCLVELDKAQIQAIQEYTEEQSFLPVLLQTFSKLFDFEGLPTNPYPFFIEQLKCEELRAVNLPVIEPHPIAAVDADSHITHVLGDKTLYSLPHIVRWLNSQALKRIGKQLSQFLAPKSSVEGDIQIHKCCSLIQPTIYRGGFLHDSGTICIGADIITKGPVFEKCIDAYVNLVLTEMSDVFSSPRCIFIGLDIRSSLAGSKTWHMAAVRSNQKAFFSALKHATISKGTVLLQAVVFVPSIPVSDQKHQHADQQGRNDHELIDIQIAYTFHHISVSNVSQSFWQTTGEHLFAGVFLTEASAKQYLTLVPKLTDSLSSQFNQSILDQIFESDKYGDHAVALKQLIPIACMFNKKSVLAELNRVFLSPVSKFLLLSHQCLVLSAAIHELLTSQSAKSLARQQLETSILSLKKNISDAFRPTVNSECTGICQKVDFLSRSIANSALISERSVSALESISFFCSSVSLSLVQSLSSSSYETAKYLESLFHNSNRRRSRISGMGSQKNVIRKSDMVNQVRTFLNNRKKKQKKEEKKDEKKQSLTSDLTVFESCPVGLCAEAILIRYVFDQQLDRCLVDCLFDLFSDTLVSNMYVHLVNRLKTYSLRLEYFVVSNTQIIASLKQVLEVADKSRGIHRLGLCGVDRIFGSVAAIGFCHAEELQNTAIALNLNSTVLVTKKDFPSYTCEIALGLTGDIRLGKILPRTMLPEIKLLYAVCVEGPNYNEASTLFCHQVLLYALSRQVKPTVVAGLQIGTTIWPLSRLKQNRNDTLATMQNIVLHGRHPFILHSFRVLNGRYVPVQTLIGLYFADSVSTNQTNRTYRSTLSHHTYLVYETLFLSIAHALLWFSYSQSHGDKPHCAAYRQYIATTKRSIKMTALAGDLYNAYLYRLRYDLIKLKHTHIPDIKRMIDACRVYKEIQLQCQLFESFLSHKMMESPDHETLRMQFLSLRKMIYQSLNSDSFIFYVGLKSKFAYHTEQINEKVMASQNERSAFTKELLPHLDAVRSLFGVIGTSTAQYLHMNCPKLQAKMDKGSQIRPASNAGNERLKRPNSISITRGSPVSRQLIRTPAAGNKTPVAGNKTPVPGNKTPVPGNKTPTAGNKTPARLSVPRPTYPTNTISEHETKR